MGERVRLDFGRLARRVTTVVLSVGIVIARAEFTVPQALTNVTIVTPDAPTVEKGTIVLDQGRIVAAGADVVVPANAEVIDAAGMYAYPGFITAHCHAGIPETPRSEAERERLEDDLHDPKQRAAPHTQAANRRGIHPQYRVENVYTKLVNTDLEGYHRAGLTAALIAPRGGILGGAGAMLQLTDEPLRRSILRTDAGQHASFSADEPGRYPESLLGVFAQFRQALLDAQWMIEQHRYFDRHPQSGPRPATDPALEALKPLLERETSLVFVAHTEREIHRAINLAKEFNLRIVISGAKEAYKVVDRLKSQNVPLIVSLKFDEEPEYGKKKNDAPKVEVKKPDAKKTENATGSAAGAVEEKPPTKEPVGGSKSTDQEREYEPLKLRQERRRLWEEQVANTVRLHEAGLAFSFSTRDFKAPADLLKNLRLVLERGLPADAALRALTTTPAALWEMSAQLGRLEPGHLANVVVLSGPLAEEKSKVKYVFVEGKKFELDRDVKPEKKPATTDATAGASPKQDVAATEETSATKTPPETVATAPPAADTVPDAGPTWRCEIEADRVPKTRTGGNVLIKNATVLTVSGSNLENTSILVQNGKIRSLGSDLEAPAGISIIDGTGRFVLPGIIDCHSHMALDGINEFPPAISAEVRIGDVIQNDAVEIYRALAGGATTTHAMHGSANPIGGQNVVFKLKYRRPVEEMIVHDAPRTVKFALGENVKHSNFPEAWGKRFPNTRMGVEAVIRDAFTAGRQYARQWDDHRLRAAGGEDVPALRRDLRLEALADVLAGNIWVHTHCYRSDEILRLLDVSEDFGFRIAVLQHVLEGYRVAPEIARHGCGGSSFANFWAYKVESYGAIPYNAALMSSHGILMTVNSDSSNVLRYLNVEAAKCIKWGGMTENAALRLITLNAAIQLGIAHRVGSIEVGKDADFAIFNGHPLNTYAGNVMTMIDGEVYFEDPDSAPGADAGPLEWNKSQPITTLSTDARAYALVGGTVHTMSGEALARGTVVIREDRIEAVGADLAPPADAVVINAAGMEVYPGMIDAGGELGLTEVDSLRATRDISDIATFAPELQASSAIHPHSDHVRIARAVGITSQLVRPAGGRISGQSAVIDLDGWTLDDLLRRDPVGLHLTIPILPQNLAPDDKEKREKEHTEALRELEDFLAECKAYRRAQDAAATNAAAPPEADLRLEAMIPYLRGDAPVLFNASGFKAIVNTLDFAEKHGFKPILVGGTEAWKVADVLKEKNIPVILNRVLAYPRGDFEAWDSIYRCAAELDRAGVSWCFASDGAPEAYNLPMEAGMAVAHGLPPERAMHALTLGAAKVLGIDDQVGSLEPGKAANVMVCTYAPIQTVSQVTQLFIRGRPVDLSNLHTQNYEKFKNRPAPKLAPNKPLIGPPSMTQAGVP